MSFSQYKVEGTAAIKGYSISLTLGVSTGEYIVETGYQTEDLELT